MMFLSSGLAPTIVVESGTSKDRRVPEVNSRRFEASLIESKHETEG